MHIIYRVTYIPHLNTNYPKYYIGSKYNYKGNYYGSLASNQIFEFTENLPLKKWWKSQDKSNFKFEILEICDVDAPKDLVEIEKRYHLECGVLNEEYFNQSIATLGFCSCPKTSYTKKLMSQKTKDYWDSPEGQKKKQRLADRNRKIHSDIMKNRWQNLSDEERKSIADKVRESKKKKLSCNGTIFGSLQEASSTLGIHMTTISYRCKSVSENFKEWYYI